jgi:DNA sulfur modification protein DndB
MCPLRLIPRVFLFNEEELVPELRAQRVLNKSRLPEIARYILDNREDYVFSALTASIDGDVSFVPAPGSESNERIGTLHVPMTATFVINDGQHRRAAIELAIREEPQLADETIAVVFFLDVGLHRSQQMFADLNRFAVKPSKSLGVLYDHRDHGAQLARLVVLRSPVFRGVVEMERSTLAVRSRKLFTLSAIYAATRALVGGQEAEPLDALALKAADYWEEVAKHFPEWQLVRDRKMSAGEIRSDFIHSHGIVLQALGRAGSALWANQGSSWKEQLSNLETIDWSRNNAKLWEGRAMIGGKVTKGTHNVTLTTNVIKRALKLELTPEEQRVEDAFQRGDFAHD